MSRPPKQADEEANPAAALSESGDSDADVSVRGAPRYPKDDDLIAADNADEDMASRSGSGSEDEDEDVFVVEEIKQHLVDKGGELKFQIKWEGWPSKKDWTWEGEENLLGSADEILQAYYDKHGGREAILQQSAEASSKKKRGRQAAAPAANKRAKKNGHPDSGTPPVSAKKWSPPSGSWEDEIELIEACEQDDNGRLLVYLSWKNGQKTKHDTDVIYKKCPQKVSDARHARASTSLTESRRCCVSTSATLRSSRKPRGQRATWTLKLRAGEASFSESF